MCVHLSLVTLLILYGLKKSSCTALIKKLYFALNKKSDLEKPESSDNFLLFAKGEIVKAFGLSSRLN